MATRKVTITLDENIYRAIKNNTDNVSKALNDCAKVWLAREKQRRTLEELLAEKEEPTDEEKLEDEKLESVWGPFFEKFARDIRDAHGHD